MVTTSWSLRWTWSRYVPLVSLNSLHVFHNLRLFRVEGISPLVYSRQESVFDSVQNTTLCLSGWRGRTKALSNNVAPEQTFFYAEKKPLQQNGSIEWPGRPVSLKITNCLPREIIDENQPLYENALPWGGQHPLGNGTMLVIIVIISITIILQLCYIYNTITRIGCAYSQKQRKIKDLFNKILYICSLSPLSYQAAIGGLSINESTFIGHLPYSPFGTGRLALIISYVNSRHNYNVDVYLQNSRST